ncbi:TIGR04222 domain-containing membrane protein, partial [Micromonospora sp. NPDC051296]|uniref:TIGR04222 domain-containing membrane protein n=1 Tax=Micromonospora sp. NPDC051296 TaxID=3155046 RepID=UPI00341A0E94
MHTDDLTPAEAGWLRGGNWAATQTALATMHRRGAVRASRGMVERVALPRAGTEPLERALYGVLYGTVGPRELMNKPRSRAALRDVRRKLSKAGLVRSPWRRVVVPAALITLPALLFVRLAALGVAPDWAGAPVV